MWYLAAKQFFHQPLRSLLSVGAIASAIAVILLLRGFEQGLYLQSRQMVINRGGQLILAQAGVENFHVVRSSLPQLTRAKVEAVAGVKTAHPVTGFWVIYGPENRKMPLFLLVYDDLGGPTEIFQGSAPSTGKDIILDQGIAREYDLKPGDVFTVFDYDFRVSGITRHDSALFSPMGFVSYDGMLDFFLESEMAPDITAFPLLSFLLVEAEAGRSPAQLAQAIEKSVPEVDVFTPAQLAQNDVNVGREMFGPIMGVLIALSYLIGLLVITIIVHTLVSTHLRQYGILKALGFRLSDLVLGVVVHLLISMVFALPLGVAAAWATATGIEWFAPVYRVYVLEPAGLLVTTVGVLIMSMAGGLIPLRLVHQADPLEAFKVE